MLHFDGERLARLDTGTAGDLWWPDFVGPDELRFAGEAGLVP